MNTTAYLVLLVDPRPDRPAIAGVEVYSGEHPAIMPLVGITILTGRGDNYEAGLADLRRQLQLRPGGYDPHGWMVALMTDRTRAELGRAR